MRYFSTFRAVSVTLPLLAAALFWACNVENSPSGSGASDALKGGIPSHGSTSKSDNAQAGRGGSTAKGHDDDASVDEAEDAGQHGDVDQPKKHNQDSGVDEDDQGDENAHGKGTAKGKGHADKNDKSNEH